MNNQEHQEIRGGFIVLPKGHQYSTKLKTLTLWGKLFEDLQFDVMSTNASIYITISASIRDCYLGHMSPLEDRKGYEGCKATSVTGVEVWTALVEY